ncbi:hypothetical protein GCM10009824_12790 [Kocuria atrinae]|uniref:Exonuclease domain-containing protein n=2 Tax=Kocuria atrinae TaxID=592377 RepID=A0ABP5JAR9_9MICC
MPSPQQHSPQDQPALFDVPEPPQPAEAQKSTEDPAQDTLFDVAPRPGNTPPTPPTEPAAAPAPMAPATPWTELPRACFDLETTGRDPQTARIVTASVVLVAPDGTVLKGWEWLADPGVEIPEAAAAVHGITTEKARAEGQAASDVVTELTTVLSELWADNTPVLAFNAAYDLTVLARECERHDIPGTQPFPVLDPFILNKQVHRFRKGKRTLGALCEEYGVVLDAAHTSAADALATERLAAAMAEKFTELQATASELHHAQIGWAAEQAASLQEYFRRRDPDAVVDGTWPVHPRG